MSPVIVIIGWLVLNAAVALAVAIVSHGLQGTFAEKSRRAAVTEECPRRDTYTTLPSLWTADVRPHGPR
jgi:hypothetical protein